MDIHDILKVLPHRYPMLLVDRILEVDPEWKRVKGLKNVTMNEQFFVGHYPNHPVMPGVLIIEAMAQVGAVMLLLDPRYVNHIPLIGSIDDVRFKVPVVPGDQLITDLEVLWVRGNVVRVKGIATVDGKIAAQMEMTCKIVPKDS
ncbi:MAG: 3-hydroxyacyl-ACP dehydratase FabZ [Fimbriimonadaceae bacterium]|jgi:beta-hydroxyacyl-ACP dehydratase FabZ|nr:3-hydroxyacyl-ACP dehydratase FabZ [Fimbriimonadaceae bacterium]